MKVIHLNTKEQSGGAARAANRLHVELAQLNINSKMVVAQKESADSRTLEIKPLAQKPLNFRKTLERYLNRHIDVLKRLLGIAHDSYTPLQFEYYSETRPAGYELFSDGSSSHKDEIIDQLPSGDIYHLHWIARFIDYKTFFSNSTKFYPIVWTLHDMNAFTGGCHYDLGCGKFITGCGRCPQLGSTRSNDLSSMVWHSKQQIFKNMDPAYLHIVTPSQWLANHCSQSPILEKFPLTVIRNGLDLDVFAPRERLFARDVLGIPQDADTLLFVAESVDNRRKGFRVLIDALSGISGMSQLHLLIVGDAKSDLQLNFQKHMLGKINNDRLLSLIYSAADIYIIPSLQDNLPNTVLESLSCGTPVIGFDSGGIGEMIKEGINGHLAPTADTDALRRVILETLAIKEKLRRMAINCRNMAIENYSNKEQADKYIALYKTLLNR